MSKSRCPHCGKDYTKTPQELALLDRIGQAAAKAIKICKRVKL